MTWPAGTAADSIVFQLGFIRPTIDPKGKLHPAEADLALPVFNISVPRQTHVALLKPSRKRFPHALEAHGVGGHLTVRFVIDTTGHADMSTFHDASPEGRSRLSASDRAFYDEFLAAARDMVADGRYTPARIAGCLVREVAEQPFTWMFQ